MAKVLIAIILAFLLLIGSVQAAPKIKMKPDKFDFGMVAQNSTVAFQTWIYASGEDSLVIDHIKTGCGCLAVTLESNRVAPGDSIPIMLLWRTRHELGEINQSPYLFTNTGPDPLNLQLTATNFSETDTSLPVTFLPSRMGFALSPDSKDNYLRFRIINSSDDDLSIRLVSALTPEYRLDLPDSIYAHTEASGFISIGDEYIGEELERSFTVEFGVGSAIAGRRTIPVTVGDFSFRPNVTTTK